jgi:hypothetical protein
MAAAASASDQRFRAGIGWRRGGGAPRGYGAASCGKRRNSVFSQQGRTSPWNEEPHRLKRDILSLRKAPWPSCQVISAIEKRESKLMRPTTSVNCRDFEDHCNLVIDMVEL